jgi:hypothetical protein
MRAHSIALTVMSASTIRVTRFRMRREDRFSMPCLFPLADLGGKTSATDHACIVFRRGPLFGQGGRSFAPASMSLRAPRAGRTVETGRQERVPVPPALPGHVSTAPSTAARIRQVGAHDRPPCASRTCGQSAARPRQCGRAYWRARWRACCSAAVAPPLRSSASGRSAPSFAA